ncbi:MAG: DNA polymerase III subunit beta [Deltaproteobacteria bacterium]|nr:DNA polymerase III subunit beta [Deltaproteobacteria bacterium]
MDFNIKRETFLNGVQRTLGIVEKKTTMPILNNVLIRTDRNKIRVIASDREVSLIADYDAEIIEEGDITVSARKLYEMIREMQGDDVHFSAGENHIAKLNCLKSNYRLSGMSADDFPAVEDSGEEENALFKINGKVLRDLIHKTAFAMSTDDIRKQLNGVLLETENVGTKYHVRMVATDGHRLAVAYVETDSVDALNLEQGVIIPRKGLGEIRKLMEDETEAVGIGIQKGLFVIRTSNSSLKVRLIDGEYPDYRRVIPTETGLMVNFDKESVLHALKRMNVVSSDRYSSVIINFTKDKMVLNSTNPDVGEARDEIDIVYNEDDVAVAFNVAYIIDAIEVIEEKDVFFEIGIDRKPCVVRPVGNDHYLCIVMPLQI